MIPTAVKWAARLTPSGALTEALSRAMTLSVDWFGVVVLAVWGVARGAGRAALVPLHLTPGRLTTLTHDTPRRVYVGYVSRHQGVLQGVVFVGLPSGDARGTNADAVGGPTPRPQPARPAGHRRGRHPHPGRYRRHRSDRPRHRVGTGLSHLAAVLSGQLHPGRRRRGAAHPPGGRIRQPHDHLRGGRRRGAGRAGRDPGPATHRSPGRTRG